jgi:hypothetical protein
MRLIFAMKPKAVRIKTRSVLLIRYTKDLADAEAGVIGSRPGAPATVGALAAEDIGTPLDPLVEYAKRWWRSLR